MLTDCSGSMAPAIPATVQASAAAIYLSEALRLNYGEIVFGDRAKVLKPLGKPLGTYPKKNVLLNAKQASFHDPEVGGGTNMRAPMAKAIEMIDGSPARSNYIILLTDGMDGWGPGKSLPELIAEAEQKGIHVMALALGMARHSVPQAFRHYRFVRDDGADIPEKIVELFEEAHKERLGK